jgi:UDP-N-acetylmuramyl pentapeptide synthase
MIKDILKPAFIKVLHKLSKRVLDKYKPKIIAITGTVGKTSTKDAVYATLSRFESVRKSPKSFNSELGIPLTILDADNPGSDILGWFKVLLEGVILVLLPHHYPSWLVLEVGTDRRGDIKEITEWLKPDVVIVTKLSRVPVHVEAFSSPEELFEEKGNLVRALKADGTLLLNADDKDVLLYKNISGERVLLFGNSSGADLSASHYEIFYDESKRARGVMFKVVSPDTTEPIDVVLNGTLGEQHSYHILASLLLVKHLGFEIKTASKVFQNELPTTGRMRLLEGLKSSTLIDDTYNSSPVAVQEALKSLKSVKLSSRSGRRIAILGDMLELGRFTAEAHREAGRLAAKDAFILATVGVRSRLTAEEALSSGMHEEKIFQFDEAEEAGKFIKDLIKEGDVILIKGSQGMRMEKCVEELMSHPESKAKLLVRQDAEWQGR